MRSTIIFTLFAFVFTLVGAAPGGLNARRMAQGLPPLPPVRRSPTRAARKFLPAYSLVIPALNHISRRQVTGFGHLSVHHRRSSVL